MKLFFLIFLLVNCFILALEASHKKESIYWENLTDTEKSNFISNHNINDLVLEYYNGNLKIYDDEKVFELLDLLVTSDSELLPLNFYLFNKLCSESDGFISEALGKYCLNIILNDPNYAINYFTFERENLKKEKYSFQYFGMFLGYEMHFKDLGTSDIKYNLKQFEEYLNNHLQLNSKQNKETLSLFYNCISEEIKSMSEQN